MRRRRRRIRRPLWLVAARSEAFVWWRNARFGGVQFANRKLCGWRFGR